MIDMLVAGRYLGPAAMSAVSVGSQLSFFLMTFSIGLSAGGQILISQLKGAEDEAGVREAAGTFLTLTVLTGALTGGLGMLFYRQVLGLLRTPAEAWAGAADYMRMTCAGMVFAFGEGGIAAIFRGLGDSKRPFRFALFAFAVNAALDYILVVQAGLGVTGCALATVLAELARFLCGVIALIAGRKRYGLSWRCLAPRRGKLKKLLKIGVPFGVQMSVVYLANLLIIARVNTYGVAASAALGAGTKITQLFTVPMMAIGNGASTMVGQCMGAGDPERAGKAVRSALVCAGIGTAMALGITQLFPEFLIRLFQDAPDVVEAGVLYLRIVSFSYLGFACRSAWGGAALGVGFSALTMLAACAEALLGRVLLVWLLLGLFGLPGSFAAQAAAPYIAALITGVYFYSGKWKCRKLTALE